MRIHAAAAVLAVLTALALSACGGSTTTTVVSTPASAATTSTPSTTTTSSSTTQSATTASSTVAAVPHCRVPDLALSFLGQQGATGHGELGFALRNVTATSCRTFGFPGILFLTQTGAPLPTVTVRTTLDFFGPSPLAAVVIPPGGTVSFRLGVTHGISSPVGCTTAYGLQVIPPDDTLTMGVTIPQGAYECRRATVSPVRPGTSAYP
jgi:hypothetical protein